MTNTEPPPFCSREPVPGQLLTSECGACGHSLLLHVGVDHCPVCELVHHNRQLQAAICDSRVEVHVSGVDQRVLERVIERLWLRAQVAMRDPGAHFRR